MGRVKEHYHTEILAAQAEAVADAMHASPISIPGVESWSFGAVKGEEIKSFPIMSNGGNLVISLQGCASPFEPTSLTEAVRKSISLRLPSEWDDPFGDMEKAVIQLVCTRSREFFGADLTEDQIIERYKPITKKMGTYPRNLKVKVASATRFWSHDRTRIGAPPYFAGISLNAVVQVCAIWRGKDAWGIVCDVTDLQILPEVKVECPF